MVVFARLARTGPSGLLPLSTHFGVRGSFPGQLCDFQELSRLVVVVVNVFAWKLE